MLRGFRARLVVTVIALVATTVAVVALASYLLLRASLRAQLVADAVAQAEFNIAVLASPGLLAPGGGRVEFEASGLVDRFATRGTRGVFVDFGDEDPFASRPALLATPQLVDPEVRRLVADGQLAYQFLDVDGEPTLVMAGRRPPAGPDFYFFFQAGDIDLALSQLARFLIATGGAVMVVGALVAGAVARRVLRPVASAGRAAEAIAGGDLTARVAAESDDEFGRWAEAFNRMAASLEEKVAELEEAEARERRFVADVSHELRTPLTGLVTEAELVASNADSLPAGPRRAVELLVADVARLRRLVEELLEISRLDAAPAPADPAEVDLAPFLRAVIADRHPDAELTVSGDTRVVCDRAGLERIVANLLDNAREHAPGAAVWVEATVEDGQAVIRVADDGPGVPPAELPRLFDRFFKADRARGGGSGLGLAIAHRHARRLGGELSVSRRLPHGLVFELRLPVTTPLRDGDHDERFDRQPDAVSDERSAP